MDRAEIQASFDDAFDQGILFHGYADYMRDYDLFVYATADPRTGVAPVHLRYRFICCVRASVTSAITPTVWSQSLDERLIDYEQGCDLDGYVWGVKWQVLYPGMRLVPDSVEAARWSRDLDRPFHEAIIETNGHNISLVFSDLAVDTMLIGHAPFVVTADEGPGQRSPFRSLAGTDTSDGPTSRESRATERHRGSRPAADLAEDVALIHRDDRITPNQLYRKI